MKKHLSLAIFLCYSGCMYIQSSIQVIGNIESLKSADKQGEIVKIDAPRSLDLALKEFWLEELTQ